MKKLLKPTAVSLIVVLVAACGGGGGDPPMLMSSIQQAGASDQPVVVQLSARQATTIEGTVSSTRYVLKSASWQVTDTYPSPAPSLTLKNDDCLTSVKDDWFDPIMPGSGLGHSTWACEVGVTAPSVASETLYTLTLTGVDALGNRQNLQKQVRVVP